MNTKALLSVLSASRRRLLGVVLAGALLPFAISAQEVETEAEEMPAEEEEILELSPFVVDEREDTGYWTNNTLVGTRIRSNLDDLAASITVINEQFMEDTGSVDIRDALVYMANAESNSNFYNPGHDSGFLAGSGYPATQNTSRYEGRKNRLRGLKPATITRDLFISDITPDSYNMERVEINRGPNSVLFGLGSPAGVINYTTKKARYQDSTSLTARFGSFNQRRAVLDINRVLMNSEKLGQLAVRVIGLSEHRERQFAKYFEDDDRLFIAGSYSPLPNTTFRINAEGERGRAARVRPMPPIDKYSAWIDAGRPSWNPLEHVGEVNSLPWWAELQQGYFAYEANGTFINAAFARDGPMNRPVNRFPSVTTSGLWEGGLPGKLLSADFFGAQGIHDISLFDFINDNLMPPHPGTFHNNDLMSFGTEFEQIFFADKSAGFKISYGSEDYHNWSRDPLWQSQTAILVDPNTHFPDGSVNPNFGRPYMEGYTLLHDEEKERRTTRVEGYLDLDLAEKVHPLLGRHKFTFLWNRRIDERHVFGGNEGIAGRDRPNELFAEQGRLPTNAIWRRWYIGSSIDDRPLSAPGGYDLTRQDRPVFYWDMDNGTTTDPITGEELTGGWRTGMFHLEEQFTGGSKTRSEVDSKAVVIQSFLFQKGDGDDHFLVTTLGFRNDEFVGFGRSRISDSTGHIITDRSIWTFPTEPTATATGDTFTLGIVGHVLPILSLHYSDSENFEASGIRTTGTGVVLGVPTGTTEEYGFTLKLFNEKLYARVNWYEMNELDASDSAFLFRWRLPGVERRFYLELRDQGLLEGWVHPNFDYGLNAGPEEDYRQTAGDVPGLSDTANSTTSGMEVEVVVNPTPNWRFMFNVGQAKAFLKDRHPYSLEYIAERMPVWEKFFDVPTTGLYCTRGWGSTLGDCFRGLAGSPLAARLLFVGVPKQQLREWRWNMVTTYEFREGFLKNLSVGGGVRWEEAPAIGNPILRTEDGTPVPDLNNPYFGEERTSIDYWVGYQRKIWNDRMTWKIHLNVRNAFADNKDLFPTHAQPDGSIQLMAITEPTDFFISNTFSF